MEKVTSRKLTWEVSGLTIQVRDPQALTAVVNRFQARSGLGPARVSQRPIPLSINPGIIQEVGCKILEENGFLLDAIVNGSQRG
jgi:hypothetical protein